MFNPKTSQWSFSRARGSFFAQSSERMKLLIPFCLIAAGAIAAQTNRPVVPAQPIPGPPVVLAPPAAPVVAPPDANGQPWQPPPVSVTNFWNAQLRSSKRVVNGVTIDVAPLVRWYMGASGSPRPLTAWRFVTGKFVAQTAYGWQITGYLDSELQARPFILKNPPTAALTEFQQIKKSYDGMLQRQAQLEANLERAEDLYAQTEAEFKRQNYFRFAGDGLDQRLDAVNALKAGLARLNYELQTFDGRGHDPKGEFVVRCFAVRTPQVFNGMFICDHGFVIP